MTANFSTSTYAIPVVATIFIWWFSTGLILLLNGRRRSTYTSSFAGVTMLAMLALVGLYYAAQQTSALGVYLSFGCALILWGWNESAFLFGFLTGPRRVACPEECGGLAHFVHAVEAILYHEIGLALSAGLVVAISWDAPTQTGTWTFLLLWGMRISAKLNVFFGVRNLSEEFLPEGLQYLGSFFRRRAMNWFFPISVIAGTSLCFMLAHSALAVQESVPRMTELVLLATLAGLAMLEHAFMVAPIPATRLWNWSLGSRASR